MSKGEEREFHLRPRKPPILRKGSESFAWAMAFKAIAHYARTQPHQEHLMKKLSAQRRDIGGRVCEIESDFVVVLLTARTIFEDGHDARLATVHIRFAIRAIREQR